MINTFVQKTNYFIRSNMYACMCAYVRPRRVCRKLIPNSSEWNNPKTNYLKYIHTQQVSYSDTFDTEN